MHAPISPVYRPGPIGRPVEMFVGQLTSDHWDRESAVIRMVMRTDLNIEWRLRDSSWTPLEDLALRLRRSGLGTVSIPARTTNSVGSGYIPGGEIGPGLDIVRVVAHWVNVPPLAPGAPLKSAGTVWSGRILFVAGPWTMTLDARSDLLSLVPTLRSSAGLAMTHVAELTKSDFSSFTGAEAAHVLFGFQTALSFAFGRWVAPALPVGFDHSGRRVWEQWAPWRCDPFAGFLSWFDTDQSGDLQDFVAAFMTHWLDPLRSDAVRHLAQHAISAGQPRTTLEARIMLMQAATEYLGWTNLVLSSRMTEREYSSKSFPASEKLRRLLQDASIPTELPPEFAVLRSYSTTKAFNFDGPKTLTKVRNMLVHPKNPREPYELPGLLVEAWLLSMRYGNQLLLHNIGYTGTFQLNSPNGGWAHTPTRVPWATPSRPTKRSHFLAQQGPPHRVEK